MKEKFIKSTIVLIIGGIITKILGMLNKVIMARYLGTEGLGIYMMILPSLPCRSWSGRKGKAPMPIKRFDC